MLQVLIKEYEGFDWFTGLSLPFLTGQRNYFGYVLALLPQLSIKNRSKSTMHK